MIELIDQLEVQNTLGEGVIWDAAHQRLWWTDIDGKMLYRYAPSTGQLEQWQTPHRLACMAPVAKQDYLVVAFADGFAWYHPKEGKLEWIKHLEQDNSGTRMNDGRTDRQGRFWAGSMVTDATAADYQGSLYCLDQELHIRKTIDDLQITNSLCWSPDSQLLYHCDTPKRRINRYDFDAASGELSNKQVFIHTEPACYPDGSIVDDQGYLWNAQWGASQVVRYAPDGSVDLVLEIPTSQPTCVAFGGENLDLLFVTSAHQGMNQAARQQDPQAGNLFVFKTPYKGLVENPFKPSTNKLPVNF
jgi:L-arabinonolactonase